LHAVAAPQEAKVTHLIRKLVSLKKLDKEIRADLLLSGMVEALADNA
jgi:hypothetical protein